jgi:hypothetical protein
MQKIPVGQTIAFAYRYVFAHIGTIIGLTWLPAVLSSGVSYVAYSYAAAHRVELEANDPQAAGAYFFLSLFSLLVTLLAVAIIAVAITRQVLGQRSTGVIVYFALGRSEWRMMAGFVRLLLGMGVLFVLAAGISTIAFLLSGIPVGSPGQVRLTPATILAGLISWAVFLYAFFSILRMGFLLPATIVAEEKGGLRRSYELARGNFWRVLAVALALGLPVAFLVLAGEVVVLRSALGPEFARLTPAEFFQRAEAAMEQKLVPWQIFTTVMFILGSALIYSGSAFAYRSLQGPAAGPDLPTA